MAYTEVRHYSRYLSHVSKHVFDRRTGCILCGKNPKIFNYEQARKNIYVSIREHVARHLSEPLECTYCKLTFIDTRGRTRHISQMHTALEDKKPSKDPQLTCDDRPGKDLQSPQTSCTVISNRHMPRRP